MSQEWGPLVQRILQTLMQCWMVLVLMVAPTLVQWRLVQVLVGRGDQPGLPGNGRLGGALAPSPWDHGGEVGGEGRGRCQGGHGSC